MRILYDDDHNNRVAMECSSVAAIPDPDTDKWVVVASEVFDGRDAIIRTGLTEEAAKAVVWQLFATGQSVQCT